MAENQTFSFSTSLNSAFEIVKRTYRFTFFVIGDLCHPLVPFTRPKHPGSTRPIIGSRAHVLSILACGCKSQILPTVVSALTVFMIDLTKRPISGHVKPRKSVRTILMTEHTNAHVALAINTTGDVTRLNFPTDLRCNKPHEKTEIRVVIKQCTKLRCGERISISHFAYSFV